MQAQINEIEASFEAKRKFVEDYKLKLREALDQNPVSPDSSSRYKKDIYLISEQLGFIGRYLKPTEILIYKPGVARYRADASNKEVSDLIKLTPKAGGKFISVDPFINLYDPENPQATTIPVKKLSVAGKVEDIYYPSGDEWMRSQSGLKITELDSDGVKRHATVHFIHGSDILSVDSYGIILQEEGQTEPMYYPHGEVISC